MFDENKELSASQQEAIDEIDKLYEKAKEGQYVTLNFKRCAYTTRSLLGARNISFELDEKSDDIIIALNYKSGHRELLYKGNKHEYYPILDNVYSLYHEYVLNKDAHRLDVEIGQLAVSKIVKPRPAFAYYDEEEQKLFREYRKFRAKAVSESSKAEHEASKARREKEKVDREARRRLKEEQERKAKEQKTSTGYHAPPSSKGQAPRSLMEEKRFLERQLQLRRDKAMQASASKQPPPQPNHEIER